MPPRLRRSSWLGLTLLLAAAAPAHADLRTRGWISSLAMDGPRVAVGVQHTLALCDRALVWNAVAGGFTVVSAPTPSATCPADRANGGIGPVALAGSRATWLVSFGGNTESTSRLVTGSTASPGREASLAAATHDPENGSGYLLGGLVGHGALLAFARWSAPAGTPTAARLQRISGTTLTTLASGVAVLTPAATDGARIAVVRADGTVALYAASGALQRVLTPAATVRSVAVQGDRVAVQITGNRVQLFSAASGAAQAPLPLAPGTAAGIDLQGDRLVYRTFQAVRVLRPSDRRDVVVATTPRAVVAAQIDDGGGLVYGYNTFSSGQDVGIVQHLSFAQVDARLG